MKTAQIICLFSGGLDSILAAKLLEQQGLRVHCVHFVSPFFGQARTVPHWRNIYNLSIDCVDVGEEFVAMLRRRPTYGFGKELNPCVDCKILLASRARELMSYYGASCIATGEVLGQRPMSQRRDTLNVIKRDALLKGTLLRPLSALHMEPTEAELSGLVDRSRLLGISGRGRKDQLALAQTMGITEIPSPAGGCRLTEKENASRYWRVLNSLPQPTASDFYFANTGRQYWRTIAGQECWLAIGRNQYDNLALEAFATPENMSFKVADFPGPLAVARQWQAWPAEAVREAAAFAASFSPRAVKSGQPVRVLVSTGGQQSELNVLPCRDAAWGNEPWEAARAAIRAEQKERQQAAPANKAYKNAEF
jgi:tRNA-uridine 2-sulfurtransferase